MKLIIQKCIAVFILSAFGISNISCNVPFSKKEAPKEELIVINVDSISDLALINELKANRFTRDTMFSWRFSAERFLPYHTRYSNPDSLSLSKTIDFINTNKFCGKIKMELIGTSNDTIFVKIPDSEFLISKIDDILAMDFLSTTTFILTDLQGMNYVNFDLNSDDDYYAGTYSKRSVVETCLVRKNKEFKFWNLESNTLKPTLKKIGEEEFNKIAHRNTTLVNHRYETSGDRDSLYKVIEDEDKSNELKTKKVIDSLKMIYTNDFIYKKNCLKLNSKPKQFEVCRNTYNPNFPYAGTYRLADFRCGYIVIKRFEYEWEGYELYNPEKRRLISIEGEPIFVDNSYVVGVYQYYGSGGFELYSLKDPTVSFQFGSWRIVEAYRIDNVFYFKFTSDEYFDNSFKMEEFYQVDFGNKLNL